MSAPIDCKCGGDLVVYAGDVYMCPEQGTCRVHTCVDCGTEYEEWE